MSGRHATAAELELYVLGALDVGQAESFEAHCAECDSCAAALSGEAALELSFEQVARRSAAAVPATRPLRVLAYGAAGVVAMAATVLLWVGRSPGSMAGAGAGAGDGTAATSHAPLDEDAAILDARNDALDGG